MGRRLSAAERIDRLIIEGFSRKQIAQATGYSTSTIGRVIRGESKGENVLPSLREFSGLGKKAKAEVIEGERQLEHAKPAPAPPEGPAKEKEEAPPPRIVSPLERAEGQFSALDRGGVEQVMVHITSKSTGRSRTLWANGGIETWRIRDNLRRAMEAQAFRQGKNSNVSDEEIDWDDVLEIEFQEYY